MTSGRLGILAATLVAVTALATGCKGEADQLRTENEQLKKSLAACQSASAAASGVAAPAAAGAVDDVVPEIDASKVSTTVKISDCKNGPGKKSSIAVTSCLFENLTDTELRFDRIKARRLDKDGVQLGEGTPCLDHDKIPPHQPIKCGFGWGESKPARIEVYLTKQ